MKLKLEQLDGHLKNKLALVYVVSGDEPLLVAEAADAIRARAREGGYSDRLVLNVEPGFDWGVLREAAGTLSLFADRRIIELRLPTGKPGDTGAKTLVDYAGAASEDNLLLVTTGKLEAAARKSRWLNALEAAGVAIQVWPVEAARLPAWIAGRMRARGLQPSREAVQLLAERVEGNLLAAAQEIEKLGLNGPGPIDADAVLDAVADSARFDVYGLVDSALQGDPRRTARILDELRGSGTEPTLVLWALAREVRTLTAISQQQRRGANPQQLFRQYQVWDKRVPLVSKGLQRHKPEGWQRILHMAARADRVIKGMAVGNIWDELLRLSLAIAGIQLLTAE